MGDYEELVELGFEGVDRFATHFHDPVFDNVSRHKPFSPRSKGKRREEPGSKGKRGEKPPPAERPRELPKGEKPPSRQDSPQLSQYDPERDLPPHPQYHLPPPPSGPIPVPVPVAPPGSVPVGLAPLPGQVPVGIPPPPPGLPPGYPPIAQQPSVQLPPPPSGQPLRNPLPRQRSYSEPRRDRYDNQSLPDSSYASDTDSDDGRAPRSMYSSYTPDRRRDGDRRYNDGGYEKTVEEREYYRPSGPTSQQMAVRSRDANRYQGALTPRAPSPPTDIGYNPRGYNDDWDRDDRPRPRRQRSSSWSPPRRSDRRRDSQSRRPRSKSPSHTLATVVGALVGGAAGSRVKKGSGVHPIATVGGAIIGGIAGRELEQQYDRYKERRERRDYERGESREKRRGARVQLGLKPSGRVLVRTSPIAVCMMGS